MFAIAVALFAAMVGVAVWGYVRIPEGTRFPMKAGAPPSFDGAMGKGTGLFVWMMLGGVVLTGSALARNGNDVMLTVGTALLAVLLLMEFFSVRRLTR